MLRSLGRAGGCKKAYMNYGSAVRAVALSPTAGKDVQILVSPQGFGKITLARERTLNALDAELVECVQNTLLSWLHSNSSSTSSTSNSVLQPHAILIDSSTPRSFCSGGDVKSARAAVLAAPYTDEPPPDPAHHIHRVFQAEYSLVVLISQYPISLVSICQGIWMGLGFGIAGFGRYRVVSDGTVFAMPENAIGLWPDVGFAYKAATMPCPALGLFLGLTGAKLRSPADLLHTKIATHYIPEHMLEDFKAALAADPSSLSSLLQQYSQHPSQDQRGPLELLQPFIGSCFGPLLDYDQRGCTPEEAVHQLRRDLQHELASFLDSQAAKAMTTTQQEQAHLLLQEAMQGLCYGSPTSQAITLTHFAAVHRAYHNQQQNGQLAEDGHAREAIGHMAWSPFPTSLEEVMQVEYHMAVERVAHPDFLEGVRAALVDKDRQPNWSTAMHPTFATAETVNAAETRTGGSHTEDGLLTQDHHRQQQQHQGKTLRDDRGNVSLWWSKCAKRAKQDTQQQPQQQPPAKLMGLCLQEVHNALARARQQARVCVKDLAFYF